MKMRKTCATSTMTALMLKEGVKNMNINRRIGICSTERIRRVETTPPALFCCRCSSSSPFTSSSSLRGSSSSSLHLSPTTSSPSADDATSIDSVDNCDSFEYPIINHPAVEALQINIRPRGKLKARHKHLFLNHKLTMQQQQQQQNQYSKKNSNKEAQTSIDNNLVLLDELAIVLCNTGVVPRKELFETYAAACRIHAKFPDMRRMADLAAGHGLLSWFLLALDLDWKEVLKEELMEQEVLKDLGEEEAKRNNDENYKQQSNKRHRPRTVICVDRRIPPSADVIAAALIERFPQLESRWCYVQADLTAIVPHRSCLLTSVHACGTLTDYLIELAIGNHDDICRTTDNSSAADGNMEEYGGGGSAPLAVVPCCHTVQSRKGYRPHHLSGMGTEEVVALIEEQVTNTALFQSQINMQEIQQQQQTSKNKMMADVVDEVRCRTLMNAGYSVEVAMLPELFTARNRLLLGAVTSESSSKSSTEEVMSATGTMGLKRLEDRDFFQRKAPDRGGSTVTSSDDNDCRIRIPLKDDEESIVHCRSISGRELANKRFIQQIPNHFTSSIVMSMWLTGSAVKEASSSVRDSSGGSVRDGASIVHSEDADAGDLDKEKESFLRTLQAIANQCCKEYAGIDDTTTRNTKDNDNAQIICTVVAMGQMDIQPSTGRRSQRYKFSYGKEEGALKDIRTAGVSRNMAKRIHDSIRQKAVDKFGDLLR